MKNILFLLVILLAYGQSQAQQVFWASKVIDFSSQYNTKEFSAQQVLGPPNALPQYGKNLVAWAPANGTGTASITVSFEKAIQVQQIAIGENLRAGSVEKIWLYDEKGKEYQVYNNPQPGPVYPDRADMFNHLIPLTPYRVTKLKLQLNYKKFSSQPQIDCIGISPDKQRIVARINTIAFSQPITSPENLGRNVNSPYPDMLPIISPDGRTLYFARKNAPENLGAEKKDDIYFSEKLPNGQWSVAKNIGAPLNTDEHNFVCAISPDGKTMYLANRYDYRTEGNGVAVSYRQNNGTWSKPKPLNINNMYNLNKFACYHVSLDEKVMVMAIERSDSYGDMDLYVSFRYADGNWSEPMNMGADLNTAGAEASVFLAADGKTLYFASNGHAGYGDFDMFMSKRLDNSWKNWSTPVNLGEKINTPGRDIYYTIPASGDYAYYSSDRMGYGYNDLFRILLPKELRPDAVNISSSSLYTSAAPIDVPRIKPYQESKASDLDLRIEELKKQLSQAGTSQPANTNTPPADDEMKNLQVQQDKLNSELTALQKRYQQLEQSNTPQNNNDFYTYTPENNTGQDFYTTPAYDPTYDTKINDLKRQLDRLTAEQPAMARTTATPSGNADALSEYEKKLESYKKPEAVNGTAATTPSTSSAQQNNKALNAYEEKLKKLREQQNKAPQPVPEPVRLPAKDVPGEMLAFDEPEPEPAAPATVPAKKEDSKMNNITPIYIPEKAVENTPAVVSSAPEPVQKTSEKAVQDQQKAELEAAILKLQQEKEALNQQKNQASQETASLNQNKEQLLSEKDQIAMSIAQMQREKEQLALEKEKLENERKKLEALRNQQYKDINTLKRELDSLNNLQARAGTEDPVVNIDQELAAMKKAVGEKVGLKNVYFVANASFLQAKSYADLDRVAVYLLRNKDISIEIGGHTNGLCDDAFCNELSTKRAKSVMDYLVSKGVPVERLSYKGYGKTQNLVDNNSEANRKLNQRVEITITKIAP